jgi:calcineurin-like phosphoesterase family protein
MTDESARRGVPVAVQASPPPARPTSASAEQIGFVQQPFVRWFHPFELARAGVRTVLADMFGAYADKRELQAALHPRKAELAFSYVSEQVDGVAVPRRELWLDFVADIGDGFNATFAVASCLARPELELAAPDGAAVQTRRGSLLIMGGDEVYPAASRTDYEQRAVGPYRAAFPYFSDEGRAPHLFAIPGNHDWYDGLSAFLRQFTQRRWVGAWKTRQERSYFVLELPHRVWVWGIDIQLHADVDGPQLEYFDAAAAQLQPGDRVILCTAEPSWVAVGSGKGDGYRNLVFIENKALSRGAQVVLVLTGDSHHYARYEEPDSGRLYVTAGGGGAFLHGTHTLPGQIPLRGVGPASSASRQLLRRATFPSPVESLAQVGQLLKFSMKNRAFAVLWGVLWLLSGWCLFSASVPADTSAGLKVTFVGALADAAPTRAAIARLPYGMVSVLLALLLALVLLLFASRRRSRAASEQGAASEPDLGRLAVDVLLWLTVLTVPALVVGTAPLSRLLAALARSPMAVSLFLLLLAGSMVYVSHPRALIRVIVGFAHATSHVLSWLLIATCTASWLVPLAGNSDDDLLRQIEQLATVSSWLGVSAALAGLASATIFGVYLWFAGKYLPEQLNDAFSALGIQDFKNFIRLHLDREGCLTVYPVGLRRVPRAWIINRDPDVEAPFLIPNEERALEPELIEPPIRLPSSASRERAEMIRTQNAE